MLPPTGTKKSSGWGQWLGGIAGLAVLALAFWALRHIAADTSWAQIMESVHATPTHWLLFAGVFAAASYVVLIAYDWIATNHLGYILPLKTLATASFASFTMSHTLGLTVLTGGTVRYRIYTRAGVAPLDVALIVLLCGWTFWLGVIAVAGLGLIVSPDLARPFVHLTHEAERFTGLHLFAPQVERWAGFMLLGLTAAYIVLTALKRTPLRWRTHEFTLPSWRETLAQIAVGAIDLSFAAAALYVLLPAAGRPSFTEFATIYGVAMIVGALSHSPGGLGVFEVVVVKLTHDIARHDVLAALVLFRLIYTFIPFLLGLCVLLWTELRALSAARRETRQAASAP